MNKQKLTPLDCTNTSTNLPEVAKKTVVQEEYHSVGRARCESCNEMKENCDGGICYDCEWNSGL